MPDLRSKQISSETFPDKQAHSRGKPADGDILRTLEDDTSGSSDAVMMQSKEISSTKRDFSLRFHCKEKNRQHYDSSEKQDICLESNVTDIQPLLCSSPVKKESVKDGNFTRDSNIVQSSLTKYVTLNKRKHESISSPLTEVPVLRNGSICCQSTDTKCSSFSTPAEKYNMVDVCGEDNQNKSGSLTLSKLGKIVNHMTNGIPSTDKIHQGEIIKERKSEKKDLSSPSSILAASEQPCGLSSYSQKVPLDSKIGPTMQFSLKDLMERRKWRLTRLRTSTLSSRSIEPKRGYAAASLDLSQPLNEEGKTKALAAAATELERMFRKENFAQMKVIGQFNLGFIIGKLDQDLFIVDQHAADEKYNYERLSESTILNQQPLLRPLKMELSPEEEIIVSMNMDTIRRNGFTLEEDLYAPPGLRFHLKAVPFSQNITFGVADAKELISILADDGSNAQRSYRTDACDSVCPPRVRAMLASRACRTSVMVGDPLDRNEMHKILEHLARLKSPWNCPHGRPTMRHLIDLNTVRKTVVEDPDATF
ncbi:unnamed protein product [Cuscuta campestris]|uniref:MutL C-terminal dimerisation domain-containing protein n=1 Tax=Cuscuta campestris TaxID=132261 RepID=A0A484LBV9_9ASTE|nr:unnamed protein product [Cuscuta campestris]